MWGIGRADRRCMTAFPADPEGWPLAATYGPGPLNRMATYAFRDPDPYLTRYWPTQDTRRTGDAG